MDGFCFKRNSKLKKIAFQKFMKLAPTITEPQAHYIMNSGIFGTQAYS